MWLTSTNPEVLLDIVQPPRVWPAVPPPPTPATLRRSQLFGCACARTVWGLLPTDERNAVVVRERFADGRATDADLRAALLRAGALGATAIDHARACARYAAGYRWGDAPDAPIHWEDGTAARSAAKARATRAAGPAPPGGPRLMKWQETWNATFAAARAHQCELVRDIFPPPGYAPFIRPDWRTSTVAALARHMDETGDFSAVPILADALQDAGCDDDVMLARCRAESNVHCRGNWVVDLVLGAE